MGELDEAIVSSVELVSLLESTADQVQSIINECKRGITDIVEKFLELRKLDVIFQLLQGHFFLLKGDCGVVVSSRMSNISMIMKKVVQVVTTNNEIELFKNQHEFFDNISLLMQNFPASDVAIINAKCKQVALFSSNYGCCCREVNDYIKAAMLHNPAIALRKLVFGDKSNNYKNYAFSYHDLGCALENSNHFSEAKTTFQMSIELKKEALDFKNEKKKKRKHFNDDE